MELLLREKLASKLNEVEMEELVQSMNDVQLARMDKLKVEIDYIEYKCKEIERSLRASDRYMKAKERERREFFRDRSPLRFRSTSMFAHHRQP